MNIKTQIINNIIYYIKEKKLTIINQNTQAFNFNNTYLQINKYQSLLEEEKVPMIHAIALYYIEREILNNMNKNQEVIDKIIKKYTENKAFLLKLEPFKKYVAINIQTGEISNSMSEEEFKDFDMEKDIENFQKHVKLIEYKCLNDPEFELYNTMKLK